MIQFFYFTRNVTITRKDHELKFDGITGEELPVDKIYFSTPSDFRAHVEHLKPHDVIHPFPAQHLLEHPDFPVDIGFGELEEKLARFKGQGEVKIAIINAISRGIGDYLMGMKAFKIWHHRASEFLQGTKLTVTFFQFDPFRLAEITYQHMNKIDHLHRLPEKASLLGEQDAYIDFGDLLAREGFDSMPMIDFFLKAFSINPESVESPQKNVDFDILPENKRNIGRIFSAIRSKGRPILLFHRTSTSPIREMNPAKARQVIAKIIEKTDYFVVSADGLDYQNKRFIDLKEHSTCLNDLAAIISNCDHVLSVDTCVYHFASASKIPATVLFTSIEPELRTAYYPLTKSIMLEEPDGLLYGKHKESTDPDEQKLETDHLKMLWDRLDTDDLIRNLPNVMLH